jgi:hypothetical protein
MTPLRRCAGRKKRRNVMLKGLVVRLWWERVDSPKSDDFGYKHPAF